MLRTGTTAYVDGLTTTPGIRHEPLPTVLALNDEARPLPLGPTSVQLPNAQARALTVGLRVRIDRGVLALGAGAVRLGPDAWWPEIRSLAGEVPANERLRASLTVELRSEAQRRIALLLEELLEELLRSADNRCVMGRLLERLIGFGPGLTPAGDDALSGLLLGLRYWSRETQRTESLSVEVLRYLDSHPSATTTISAQMLRHACAGWPNQPVDAVLTAGARLDGSQSRHAAFDEAVQALLRVGSSSGADTLLGLACALPPGVDRDACDQLVAGARS